MTAESLMLFIRHLRLFPFFFPFSLSLPHTIPGVIGRRHLVHIILIHLHFRFVDGAGCCAAAHLAFGINIAIVVESHEDFRWTLILWGTNVCEREKKSHLVYSRTK